MVSRAHAGFTPQTVLVESTQIAQFGDHSQRIDASGVSMQIDGSGRS